MWLRLFSLGGFVIPHQPSDKTTLRQHALALRDALPLAHRQDAAQRVADGLSLTVQHRTVSAYHAIGSEIDPAPLMQVLGELGAQLALPVLLDRETMVLRQWDQSRDLVSVGFGTLGPDGDQPEVVPDLIFAPLAAFSAAGQRIGYGKGHYDRALAKMHAGGHRPAFVGLAFEEQEVLPFAADKHDVQLDGVLTPAGLRVFDGGQGALAPFLS